MKQRRPPPKASQHGQLEKKVQSLIARSSIPVEPTIAGHIVLDKLAVDGVNRWRAICYMNDRDPLGGERPLTPLDRLLGEVSIAVPMGSETNLLLQADKITAVMTALKCIVYSASQLDRLKKFC